MDLHQLQKTISSYFLLLPDGQQQELDPIIEASLEFNNLKNLILKEDHSIETSILKELFDLAEKKGFQVSLCDRLSIVHKRSMGLRIQIERIADQGILTDRELVLAISLLAPVHFMEIVQSKSQIGFFLEEGEVIESAIPQEFAFIQEYLNRKGYTRMDSNIYEIKIPDIAHLEIDPGEFTYFNGLFGNSVGDLMY
jgi:hypothetical protein